MPVRIARLYTERAEADGYRILVDRLWPRGIRKDDPRIDEWVQAVAPSTELRHWYGHAPQRFEEFCRRYEAELAQPDAAEALSGIREQAGHEQVTLVTATRELDASHLVVLARALND